MAIESDLSTIAHEIAALEGRFNRSSSAGLFLRTDDKAAFKRLTVEAKSILDAELGYANNFSMELIHSIRLRSGGYLGGPSLAAVKEARQLIEGAVNHILRRPTASAKPGSSPQSSYVDTSRLAELRSTQSSQWDVTRLIRLCEELNGASENGSLMSVAMIVRAIVDHVPPLFGCRTFTEVANNTGGAKSFKGSMQHLDKSLRNVADSFLH